MRKRMLLDVKPNELFYLLSWPPNDEFKRLCYWTGKQYIPKGCCNTLYVLIDVESKKEIEQIAESWIDDYED